MTDDKAGTVRAARLIVYEGPQDWVEQTLKNSKPLGRNEMGPDRIVRVLQLPFDFFELEAICGD